MDLVDRLEVKITQAEDLALIESSLPSPYVEVTVGLDSKRTKPYPESANPQWNAGTMIFNHILGMRHSLEMGMCILSPYNVCRQRSGSDVDGYQAF
jgi:hypothetical protein